MILFILEGNKPDRSLYQAMMKICGVDEETVAVVYGCNNSYCVSRQECRNFKQLASEFSYYPNIDFLTRVGDLELKQN